jgi:hypothetical protein
MNTPQDDDLTQAYRDASAKDAGRPAAATRQAILDSAAAAARTRIPAANDSRYLWRGVAGVAVLGVGLLLWRQVDHRMPGDPATLAVQQLAEEEKAADAMPPAAAPSTNVAEPVSAEQEAEARAQVADKPVASARREQAPEPAPAPPTPSTPAPSPQMAPPPPAIAELSAPLAARNSAEREESRTAASADTASRGLRAEPLGKQAFRAEDGPEAEALLRAQFPLQYASDRPHNVWVVRDGAGNILRSGELAAGTTLGEIRPQIERDLGGRLLRPWRIHTLVNARGQEIEFGIAQTP